MQANTANEHSQMLATPSSEACGEQAECVPPGCSLVSYRTLAWNFDSSKQAVDASKYSEPSPERLIKDDEQA